MTDRTGPRSSSDAALAVGDLLAALGFDPSHPAIVDTPRRVARAWEEMLSGYDADPETLLSRTFDTNTDDAGLVLLRGVEFHSTCEHHLLPFSGIAHVGYIPTAGRVVGLSKLARVVDAFARRLQMQERMTSQIADAIHTALQPLGVGVVVDASHACMVCRGARKPRASMVTSCLRGVLLSDPSSRAEFMRLTTGTTP